MGRITRSIQLFKITWQVLMNDTRMLVFPLLSALCAILLLVPLILSVLATWAHASSSSATSNNDMLYSFLLALGYYLCVLTLSTYFNAALVYFANRALAGQTVSIGESFSVISKRLPLIVAWALVSATVGALLRLLAQSHNLVADIIELILGLAWGLISFLALPILVLENKNPFTALKEAVHLVKNAWGEQIILSTGFGLIFGLVYAGAIGLFSLAIAVNSSELGHLLMTLAVVIFLIAGLMHTTLARIFETALYNYARNGTVSAVYSKDILEHAISKRRRRSKLSN